MRHAPITHDALALAGAHDRPQPPQWVTVSREASHPVLALLSQSPKPARHVVPQAPATQKRVVFIGVGQDMSQAPQWSGSVCVARQTAPHTVCPGVQIVEQRPAVHDCPAAQALPHAPQCLASA
jgi:hypothetical protein